MPEDSFYINTAFENGSPLNWEHTPEGNIVIDLIYDHERGSQNRQATHWHFLVCGPVGQTVQITFNSRSSIYNGKQTAPNFREDYISFVSADGDRWECVTPKLSEGNTLTLALTMTAERLYVARLEPYTTRHLRTLLEEIGGRTGVTVETMGRTVEGRDVEMITLSRGRAPHRVLLRARSHPWEPGGSWFVDGLIRGLLADTAKADRILSAVDFHVIPMANKDGVVRGLTRFNVNGIDLNRGFGRRDAFRDGLAPENEALMDWLLRMESRGQLPDLAMDLHNDKGGKLHVGTEPPETPGFCRRMELLERLMKEHSYFTEGAAAGGTGIPVPTFGFGLRKAFGIDSLVFELHALYLKGAEAPPTGALWREFGAQFAEVVCRYFQAASGA